MLRDYCELGSEQNITVENVILIFAFVTEVKDVPSLEPAVWTTAFIARWLEVHLVKGLFLGLTNVLPANWFWWAVLVMEVNEAEFCLQLLGE